MDDWRAELGPLASFVDTARDVCVDGDGRVWTESGHGFVATELVLNSRDVRRIGTALIDRGGGRVDDARPIGDASIAGRIRVHLTLPPIARRGPLLSLRFPQQRDITLDDFRFDSDVARRLCVESSVLIAGTTGSGKTTLAQAVLAARPPSSRIVIVEDIAELSPAHPHCVHLTGRATNPEGGGAITLSHLVTESLRMRPDSIVVGEIRGPEFREFLAALSAGHHGISTVHARSLTDVPSRLMVLGLLAGIPIDAIAPLVVNSVPAVAHVVSSNGQFTVTVGRTVSTNSRLDVVVQ